MHSAMARRSHETSTRYDRPYRPLPVAGFNRLGRVFDAAGVLPRLEEEALLAAARRKTGLDDFGEEWFREPLRVLIDSMNGEARLTPMGRIIQRARLVGALVTRLRTEALCREHPEILDIELGPVVVIAGLQRTGTTMLHRLLAADPAARALISWEALNPLPLPKEEWGQRAARRSSAVRAAKVLTYLAPNFSAIHSLEVDEPEEDVLLLDVSFMSQAPEATLNVPSYAAWLEGQDPTRAYAYMRKLMQVLLWQRPAEHWVLKTPHHMEYFDTLFKVFPEARVVQTHRDPRKTMGSFCSMVAHGRGVFSDHVDAREVARHWVRKVIRVTERSMASREQWGEERFLDVSYYDLLADPIAEVQRIYRFAGLVFRPSALEAMRSTQARNVQHKHGRHRYRLEDFGLTEADIDRDFSFYRERYGIPRE
jgi:hypothetical protein